MAGFEVIIYGRFWVIAEAHDRAAPRQEFSSAHLDCFFHVHPSYCG